LKKTGFEGGEKPGLPASAVNSTANEPRASVFE
jgi:hypothetical protein